MLQLSPCPKKKKEEEEKDNDEWVPFYHSLWNWFGGPNLDAIVGVDAKKN